MMNTSTSIQRTPFSRRSTSSLLVTFVAAFFAAIVLLLVAVERTDAQAQMEVWAWGDNAFGQLGDGTTTQRNTPVQVSGLSGVQAFDGGGTHSLAVASSDTTPPPPPIGTEAPTVKSTIPGADERGVARTIDVKATFSEDMLTSSINGNTFKLFKTGSTTKLPAEVSYPDPESTEPFTAKLSPNRDLTSGATYKAVVTTGTKDTDGNPLDQNPTTTGLQQKAWFFTVS